MVYSELARTNEFSYTLYAIPHKFILRVCIGILAYTGYHISCQMATAVEKTVSIYLNTAD